MIHGIQSAAVIPVWGYNLSYREASSKYQEDSTECQPYACPRFGALLTVIVPLLLAAVILFCVPATVLAQPSQSAAGGEAHLILPDLGQVTFLGGTSGRTLLMWGLGVCALGLVFGLVMYTHLRNLPVHASMLEISELIYETCKTYLITQGKFLLILEIFIGAIIVLYFGVLQRHAGAASGRSFCCSA